MQNTRRALRRQRRLAAVVFLLCFVWALEPLLSAVGDRSAIFLKLVSGFSNCAGKPIEQGD